MNSDGSGVKRLTFNTFVDGVPIWSPDGSKIAFNRYHSQEQNAEVMVMNADGSDEKSLSQSLFSDYGASWSPDGSQIAFSSSENRW